MALNEWAWVSRDGADDDAETLVIGGFGVVWTWATDLLREACGRAVPPIEVAAAGRDNDVGEIGLQGGSRRLLMVQRPDERVFQAIESRRVPVLVLIDDPVDCVRLTMSVRGCDAAVALREQTASAATHHLCVDHPRALVVQRGAATPAREIARRMLAHLGLDLPVEARHPVLERLAGPDQEAWSLEAALMRRVPGYVPLDQLARFVTTDDATMVRQALSPMIQGAITAETSTIVWPARALLFGDRPDNAPPPVVDLTGSARTIYYGPYFHLPPGTWRVTIVLAVTHAARGQDFQLNFFCALKPIARALLKPSSGGSFVGSFLINHRQPLHSLEINLLCLQGMIEGHIAFGPLTFTKVGP